jgi:L-threonylcarbamoyladenylate synthase
MIPLLIPTEKNLNIAAEVIRQGGLISFPTETVYGLGANALDALALAKIFEVKQRPYFDPLIVHIADRQALESLCLIPDSRAEKLMTEFWPGPLTLVLPKKDNVPDLATSGLATVAVRIPAHPVALKLIRLAGVPIAAPSANPFGRLSPTTALHVQGQFAAGIEYIIDGGSCAVGVESTIVSLVGPDPVLLRAGGIPREEIEALIGPIFISDEIREKPQAPGQLAGHYAPRTQLRLQELPRSDLQNQSSGKARRGLLAFQSLPINKDYTAIEILSPTGNLREAAANLFACLHRLDKMGLDYIEAENLPMTGLGLAIMDRLRKAAVGSRGQA